MEPNELAKTEDVITTTVGVAAENSDFGIGVAVGGLAVLGGTLLYKYAIKPLVVKIKAWRKKPVPSQVYNINVEEVDDEENA
jgi:hypothetical protein